MTSNIAEISAAVQLLRKSTLENLSSAQWLEHVLIPRLGLTKNMIPYMPSFLHNICDKGIKSFQSPVQFSKYLAWASRQGINSYLELGVFEGGTFIITLEYLSRFNKLEAAIAIDPYPLDVIKTYVAELRQDALIVVGKTSSPESHAVISERVWGLTMVDADHTEDGCWADYVSVKDNSRFVALHDTVSDKWPGVAAVWQRIKSVTPARKVVEFNEQYFETAQAGERFFGIGVVDLS